MQKFLSIFFLGLLALTLGSCGQGDVLYVDKVVVNLSPVKDNPSSGYLDLHGGRMDVELVGVTADDALRVEMHETVEEDGMASMQPVLAVEVPAGETVKFEPGGKHLMIWGVGGGSVAQGRLTMVFIFSDDSRIEVDAVVRKIGDPQPEAAETE